MNLTRRPIVAGTVGVLLSPRPTRSQDLPKMRRIGVLSQSTPREYFRRLANDLQELGYVEGRHFVIEFRFAQDAADRLPALAAELVAAKVDVIVALLNTEIAAARRATSTIPIVMMFGIAPVEVGFVASLARPGGNVTGTSSAPPELAGKSLEIFSRILPRGARVTALLPDPDLPGAAAANQVRERAAVSLGLKLTSLDIRSDSDLQVSFNAIERDRPDGLLVRATGLALSGPRRFVDFAARTRIPTHHGNALSVRAGGLISYSVDFAPLARRTAAFIDRIFKGANPADLPVEEPTNYWLAINLKTAKALGLTIPQSLLALADEVVQ